MKRPEIIGWVVTTNENGIKMATLPRDTMEEILKFVEYADKQLRITAVIKLVCPKCGSDRWIKEGDYCECTECMTLFKQTVL